MGREERPPLPPPASTDAGSHGRGFRITRSVCLLRLLGIDTDSYVLPHSDVGWGRQEIRRDEVLHLHIHSKRGNADRHPSDVLQHRHLGLRQVIRPRSNSGQRESDERGTETHSLAPAAHWIRHKDAQRTCSHMATRCTRASTDRWFDDSGRGDAEDGCIRIPQGRSHRLPRINGRFHTPPRCTRNG